MVNSIRVHTTIFLPSERSTELAATASLMSARIMSEF